MSPAAAAALAALLLALGLLVWVTVDGVRHAVAVERRYAASVHDAPRQSRRCPFCRGWFNSTELQDAHERSCDQRPTDPTPGEVLALAFPSHAGERRHPWTSPRPVPVPELVAHPRRHVLGRWTE